MHIHVELHCICVPELGSTHVKQARKAVLATKHNDRQTQALQACWGLSVLQLAQVLSEKDESLVDFWDAVKHLTRGAVTHGRTIATQTVCAVRTIRNQQYFQYPRWQALPSLKSG